RAVEDAEAEGLDDAHGSATLGDRAGDGLGDGMMGANQGARDGEAVPHQRTRPSWRTRPWRSQRTTPLLRRSSRMVTVQCGCRSDVDGAAVAVVSALSSATPVTRPPRTAVCSRAAATQAGRT